MREIEIFEARFRYIDKLKDPAGWLEAQSHLGRLYAGIMAPVRRKIEEKELHRLARAEMAYQKRLRKLGGMRKKELINIIMNV